MVDRAGNVAKAKKTTATRKTKAGTSKGVKKATAKKAAPKTNTKAKTATRQKPRFTPDRMVKVGPATTKLTLRSTVDTDTLLRNYVERYYSGDTEAYYTEEVTIAFDAAAEMSDKDLAKDAKCLFAEVPALRKAMEQAAKECGNDTAAQFCGEPDANE